MTKREWIDAARLAWVERDGAGHHPVGRVALPQPARDPWDEEERDALAEGAGRMPKAGRFSVEGKNAFFVRRAVDAVGTERVHLYDAAGWKVGLGVRSAGGSWEWVKG